MNSQTQSYKSVSKGNGKWTTPNESINAALDVGGKYVRTAGKSTVRMMKAYPVPMVVGALFVGLFLGARIFTRRS